MSSGDRGDIGTSARPGMRRTDLRAKRSMGAGPPIVGVQEPFVGYAGKGTGESRMWHRVLYGWANLKTP
jgi:hypothetical protein